jgi:hypothetical protein
MTLTKIVFIGLPFLSLLSAQQLRILLSPIPAIAPGATIPFDSPQFVFVGPNISQLTISYASSLAGIGSTERTTLLVKKLDQVVPSVSSGVVKTPTGTYEYKYSLGNGTTAADPISVWSIAIPVIDGILSASHPSWTVSQDLVATGDLPARGSFSMSPVLLASWHAFSREVIGANTAASGFVLESPYRPGLTLIYARSAEDYSVPATLPAQVSAQLDIMRQRDWMNKSLIGVGPRFPNDWTRDVIAADFKNGVAQLIRAGSLDASSPFVTAVNSKLDVLINLQGAGSALNDVIAAASSTLEKNIANAMAVSLQ